MCGGGPASSRGRASAVATWQQQSRGSTTAAVATAATRPMEHDQRELSPVDPTPAKQCRAALCVHSAFPHHADTAYPVPHVSMHTYDTARMNQTRVGPSMMPTRRGGAAATTATVTVTGTVGETGSATVTASASSVRPLCPSLNCASTTASSLRVGEMRVRVDSPCTAIRVVRKNSHSGAVRFAG